MDTKMGEVFLLVLTLTLLSLSLSISGGVLSSKEIVLQSLLVFSFDRQNNFCLFHFIYGNGLMNKRFWFILEYKQFISPEPDRHTETQN